MDPYKFVSIAQYRLGRLPEYTALYDSWVEGRRANGWTFHNGRWIVDPPSLESSDDSVASNAFDALDILNSISWYTTEPTSDATVRYSDDLRPLSREERKAILFPNSLRWILRQPDAGLLTDYKRSAFATEMKIPGGATVEYVLECISKMTVVEGKFAIEDHVYFEGIENGGRVDEESGLPILSVRTGS